MECKKNDCFNCPYPDCINDYVKKTYPRKKQWIAHQTEYVSKRAKRRAAEGLCTKCGKRPPRPGYRTCGECAMKSRRASNEHKWRNGTTPKVLMDGVTLCKKCGIMLAKKNYKVEVEFSEYGAVKTVTDERAAAIETWNLRTHH